MPEPGREEDGPSALWADAGRYMGFGLTWALSTLLFLMVGWWLDRRLGTMPWLLITGAFVGAGAGFYSLYHHIVSAARADTKRKEARARDARRESERPRGTDAGPEPATDADGRDRPDGPE